MAASSTSQGKALIVSFKKLSESLQVACDQLKDDKTLPCATDTYTTNEFWTVFCETSRLLSQVSTKICMLYSKPPVPSAKDSKKLVSELENACLAILATFNKLPVTCGRTLHKEIRLVVMAMLDAVCRLCVELDRVGPGQLTLTANVWEKCDLVKELPRDNRAAALIILKRNTGLVDDALSEFEESIENPTTDDFQDDLVEALESRNGVNLHQKESCILSDSERLLLPPCRGLVKAAKAVLKKSTTCVNRSRISDEPDQSPVDKLVQMTNETSALVDDLILATYPPLSRDQLADQAQSVSIHLKDILQLVRSSYLAEENDQQWLEFLAHAVDHNLRKINELL